MSLDYGYWQIGIGMSRKRVVVYTALFGGYEDLLEQTSERDGADFVCFTDQANLKSDTWDIRRIEPLLHWDPVRNARKLKVLGHPSLAEYDLSIWVDNRVALKVSPFRVVEELLDGSDMGVIQHDHRASVSKEFEAVLAWGRDDPARVRELRHLLQEHTPEVLGQAPYWTGILVRRNLEKIRLAMMRWDSIVMAHSRRDQLSVNAALYQSGISLRVNSLPNRETDLYKWFTTQEFGRVLEQETSLPYRYSVSRHSLDSLYRLDLFRKIIRKVKGI